MLKTEGLTLHYGGSQILHGVDIAARAGEVTCIMGTNGVGKTSLLKAIAGTHPRSGGGITLDGQAVGRVPPQAMARRGLAYVPQGRMIFPLLTVRENMETAFAVLPRAERFIPDEIYELFPILKEFLNRRGGDLSGGQQQQLAIARAMLMKPKLLLLDEPTEGIQPNIIQQIGRVIKYLRDTKGMAIILVEQYFDFAHDLGDRFYVLKRGAVAMEGTKDSLSRETLRAVVSV
ncbi:urea ABC transporter ATP-binding subunit UrtE [Rhodobacter capsulatus]|jgi:urea transport system ATP-binding protein|uniref:Urea ABC transporter, ATP-binding protein UrtE n=1 Tax=Rhodobacter capsulatus (strain ATCC BAA-309 / NBRC 16581 / SB1003) TaxID=272942 RepID=D5AS96_RHOCB|nr:urea ABC transporter ATP-binding subunit UrtE [Rhodobacter capsulatus]ADE84987.1 urea ABC transporter, ATP-binding protein UrtE [Rhodobacter capsulatus SB 1003]ETD02421.1 urea ABC transporter ATP-binding protein [Rhodobacter capsulatus DE442]ETD77713.1 urea ABC transporter ATP-binding protein [Rhodobacter capsulatus R121]ETD86776.1 urea ABC transporter ATP-binding protein [Rhodobacter capsulatus B6]ETE54363.1 urea ABC transporter ATP-binding protein [Rhodobacter capsulatus Y262]